MSFSINYQISPFHSQTQQWSPILQLNLQILTNCNQLCKQYQWEILVKQVHIHPKLISPGRIIPRQPQERKRMTWEGRQITAL